MIKDNRSKPDLPGIWKPMLGALLLIVVVHLMSWHAVIRMIWPD